MTMRNLSLFVVAFAFAGVNAQNDAVPMDGPAPVVSAPQEPYTVVEQMPEFPGGNAAMMTFLQKHLAYPADARDAGVQGRVILGFVVMADGSIADVKVLRGVAGAPSLDAEAVRVVKSMPRWNPGKQNGKAVDTKFNLPVSFKLDAEPAQGK
ncbi:MAG: energy transducer TonB [Flavobacteriales bacterium]|nr:energy transducer TonB [Flavobacteriales bacterium]